MSEHFHPEGKLPSASTIAAKAAHRAALPFDDTRDFDEAPYARRLRTGAAGGVRRRMSPGRAAG
jgi:hypothetical protein